MSNLLKTSYSSYSNIVSNITEGPLILDMNKRAEEKERENRIKLEQARAKKEEKEKLNKIFSDFSDDGETSMETSADESTNAASSKRDDETDLDDDIYADGFGKIIAKEVVMPNEAVLQDAMYMAKEIRDDALAKSTEIIAKAKAEADDIREQAQKEGYEAGLQEGSMEAMRRADEYLANMNEEQEKMISERKAKLDLELEESKRAMVDISCDLIAKLTGILVEDYKSVMLHAINQAMNESEASKKYVIKVAEQSYAYILDNKDRIAGATNPSVSIEIFGDSKLSAGQCLIESDNGIIDLSMDLQVKNLITAIKLLSE